MLHSAPTKTNKYCGSAVTPVVGGATLVVLTLLQFRLVTTFVHGVTVAVNDNLRTAVVDGGRSTFHSDVLFCVS